MGAGLYVLAALPDVVAYTLVPQVVCTTIACFRLVVVTVLAAIFLGEKAELREIIGMVTCSLGTFFCINFGPRPSEEHIDAHSTDINQQTVYNYLYAGHATLLVALL